MSKNIKNMFELLEPSVKILAKKRFPKPTPIQELVIPEILKGKNILTISETGSGKTESVILPVMSKLLGEKHKPISILYITPLKALNRDLLKRILWWAGKLDFEVSVRHGDTSQYERSMQAQNPSDFLISTPETLQAILTGKLMRNHLKNIRFIIIDEIHELVDNKRGVQLSIGLERLKELIKPNKPQIIGLSATVGSPEAVAGFLSPESPAKVINTVNIKDLNIRVDSPSPGKEDFARAKDIFAGPEITARLRVIQDLIKKKKSVLLFTNTRESSEILSSRLKALDPNLPLETHHSSLAKDIRIKAEDDFKKGKLKAMVCTSSLELGIDIGSIDFILQYMSPRQVMKFLQRVGRSGHSLGRSSEGYIISSDVDDCFEASVIAKHSLLGLIEPLEVYRKSLDVLGHQIIGLALEEYKIPAEKTYKIIKRAYPYNHLKLSEFLDVCMLLQKLGFIWLDDKYEEETVIKRRKRGFEYYFRNLSTIPDVKNLKIFDIFSSRLVGTLDAEFIALHGNPGSAFIVKGTPWRIIEVLKDRVLVEPMGGLKGAIPAWEGELIPVPFEVSQGVGKLRREILKSLEGGENPEAFLEKTYPISKEVSRKLIKTIEEQKKWFVPDDKNIVIEFGIHDEGNYIIVHSCFGSMVNETIGRVISTLLMNKFGSVGLKTDAYRIVFKTPGHPKDGVEDVANLLKKLDTKTLEEVLEKTLPNTELFRWRFLHVAKRFGVISRDGDFGKGYINKIIEVYSKSPLFKEAMNEIFQEKLDLKKSLEVLGLIKNREKNIVIKEGLSPLGKLTLERRYEIVAPEKPEKEIFSVFRDRLLGTKVGLICFHCGKWVKVSEVKELPEELICTKCRSRLISVVPVRYMNDAKKLLQKSMKKEEISAQEARWLNMMFDSASLVIHRGTDAVKVLAGRGIGSKTAGRVLAKLNTGEALLKDILNAEKLYAKNRQYWKS